MFDRVWELYRKQKKWELKEEKGQSCSSVGRVQAGYISASARSPASQKSLISMFSMKMRVGESRIAGNAVQSGT